MSFNVANPAKPSIVKDPDAVLDYSFDFSEWMAPEDTIATLSVTANATPVDGGTLTIDSSFITYVPEVPEVPEVPADPEADPPEEGTPAVPSIPAVHIVTAMVSGGTAELTESATFHIITTDGREDDRTMYFKVRER